MRKNIYHLNNKKRLETALEVMEHMMLNEAESASSNREDSCSDEEAFNRAKSADGLAYAMRVVRSKMKTLKD